MLRRIALKPTKKIVPITDYQVLTKKRKKFSKKSKATILTHVHMM